MEEEVLDDVAKEDSNYSNDEEHPIEKNGVTICEVFLMDMNVSMMDLQRVRLLINLKYVQCAVDWDMDKKV